MDWIKLINALIRILFVAVLILLYIAPAWIAHVRRVEDRNIVTFLSLLLGWTGICWFFPMMYAMFAQSYRPRLVFTNPVLKVGQHIVHGIGKAARAIGWVYIALCGLYAASSAADYAGSKLSGADKK